MKTLDAQISETLTEINLARTRKDFRRERAGVEKLKDLRHRRMRRDKRRGLFRVEKVA